MSKVACGQRLAFEPLEPRLVLGAGPLLISELLAVNDHVLSDQDGDFADWVEIHNPSDRAVSLDGWYLTDDAEDLGKWQFPAVSLDPGAYLLVFASNKDRSVAGAQLHTNFKLDRDGEYLALVRADGTTVAHDYAPQYPSQLPDVTYGIGGTMAVADTLVDEIVSVQFLVPADDTLGLSWTDVALDDSAWTDGETAVGYDMQTGLEPFEVKVNFQPSSSPVPAGYMADSGATFADRGNGFSYGWDQTVSDTRDRQYPNVEPRYNTINHMLKGGVAKTWEIALPNGVYDVYAVFGEIAYTDQVNTIDVEGTILTDPDGQDHFDEYSLAVTVTDGRLTIGPAAGANNAKIAFVEISGQGLPAYRSLIETDLQSQMFGRSASVYLRKPFEVADRGVFDSLTLRMKYDDGFVAYLNGHKIAERNAPQVPSFDSAATAEHSDAQALVFEEIDVSDSRGQLTAGTNVLAIHGLNTAIDDEDFLIAAALVGNMQVNLAQQYFTSPTPGKENEEGALGRVADTRFSVDRGFYDAPLEVEIRTSTDDAEIRYTTDGSQPAAAYGSIYSGPIVVDATTTLRAAAFRPGYLPTNVDTQTYIFLDDVLVQDGAGLPTNWGHSGADYAMDPDVVDSPLYRDTIRDDMKSIPTLSLVMDQDDWFGSGGRGIYLQGKGSQRAVSVELIYPDGSDGFQVDAAVQIQGGSSTNRWKVDKLSMRVKFKEPYGPTKLDFPLYDDSPVDRFDTFLVDAMMNNNWLHPSSGQQIRGQYLRDQFVSDVQNAMGGYGTHGFFVHLYLNGLYWGLHWIHERPDETFAASYFGGQKQDYYVLKHSSSTVINGGTAARNDYAAMFSLAGAGLSTDAQYEAIQQHLDVPNFIDYMITNFYVGNTDWAHHNWYATRNSTDPDGRWRYHSWDAEHVLKSVGDNVTGKDNSGAPTQLHQKLMANAEYRMLFADRVQRYFFEDGLLTPENAAALYQTRLDEIDHAIVGESARWGDNRRPSDPYTRNDEWVAERDWLLNTYFPQRTDVVLSQLRSAGAYPSVDAPTYNQHGGKIDPGFDLLISAPNGTIYYTLDGSDPRLPGGGVSPAAEVFQSATTAEELVAVGEAWAYEESGRDLGSAWREPGFDDSSWDTGDGLLYVEGSSLPAPKSTPLSLGEITYYFRKHFTFDGDLQNVALQLRTVIDDGAIVYLNGQEVLRLGMPGGDVDYLTRANRSVGNAGFEGPFTIAADALVTGDNVIAVEVHQTSPTSSDVVFGLELAASRTTTATPIALSDTTLVKARAHSGGQWSALNEARFSVHEPASAANLVIGEIHYNPHDPTPAELLANAAYDNDDFEFIELQNVGDETIELRGVRFVEGVEFDFTGGSVATLGPGESVVVVSNVAAFGERYGSHTEVAGQYDLRLSNGGESIRLVDAAGEDVVNFVYKDSGSWPGRADGKGASLELIDPAAVPQTEPQRTEYLHRGDHWHSSGEYGGSPASGPGAPIGIVINEVLTHTDPPQLDAIELYNTTGRPIDVGGWYLSDTWGWESSESNGDYKRYRIEPGTTIGGHEYLVFDERHFNPNGRWNPQAGLAGDREFALNGAHGDDVWLMAADVDGNLTHFVDHVEFGPARGGEALGRWPNGTGDLVPMRTPTLDPQSGENGGPRVGPIVISEVHHTPGDLPSADQLEFVEIYNPTGQAVDLTDWRIRKGIDFDFAAGTELAAHGTLVVLPFDPHDEANAAAWSAFGTEYGLDVGDKDGFVGGYGGRLSGSGERVQLQRPDEPPAEEPDFIPRLLEDEVDYKVDQPWPVAVGGRSLHRLGAGLWGNDPDSWSVDVPSPGTVALSQAAVVTGRYVFYNNSAFDNPALGRMDDDAVAPDKVALLPGQKATFANYTSYSRGLNGIMVDVAGLADPAALGPQDFRFRMGNSDTPDAWSNAPSPEITVRATGGLDGAHRITLIWPDYTIEKQWLQVTVLATANTALAVADVFYFGNIAAETGNATSEAMVTSIDEILVRSNPRVFDPAGIDDPYDFDRDQMVTATDQIMARRKVSVFDALELITPPE